MAACHDCRVRAADRPVIPELAHLHDVLDGLVAEDVVPGGVALIAGPEGILFERAFGLRSQEPDREPSTTDTLHDVASLTKPLVVARLLLAARARGQVAFDEPVTTWIPEMDPRAGEPRAPTVGELLLHAGGLPAWEPLYALVDGGLPERAAWLARHRDEPGRRAVYGCPRLPGARPAAGPPAWRAASRHRVRRTLRRP